MSVRRWGRCVVGGRPRLCALWVGGDCMGFQWPPRWGTETIALPHREAVATVNVGPLYFARRWPNEPPPEVRITVGEERAE